MADEPRDSKQCLWVVIAAGHGTFDFRPGAAVRQYAKCLEKCRRSADVTVARAQTEVIQAKTAVDMRRIALANLVGTTPEQLEIDATELLANMPAASAPPPVTSHPAVLESSAAWPRSHLHVSAVVGLAKVHARAHRRCHKPTLAVIVVAGFLL